MPLLSATWQARPMKSSASSYRAWANLRYPARVNHHAASDGLAPRSFTICAVASMMRSPHSNSPLVEVVDSALAAAASATVGVTPRASNASTRFAAPTAQGCHGRLQNNAEQSTPQTRASTSLEG